MSRDVPFEPEDVCDICGTKGAFDFMGDLICPTCLLLMQEDENDENDEEE